MGATRRRIAAATAAVTLAMLAPAAAWAWIGVHHATGTGTAGTGQPLDNVTVSGPNEVTLNLGQPLAAHGTIDNPNSFTVSISRIQITISGISHEAGTCTIADNFVTVDAVATPGHRFVAPGATGAFGDGIGSWSGGSILFKTTAFDQTACLGRTVSIRYKAIG